MKKKGFKIMDKVGITMKKKGFTLIELLAVLVLLVIILVISFPKVIDLINDSKNKAYENQKGVIIRAAERWLSDNPNAYGEARRRANLDDPTDKRIRIFVSQLQEEGYLNTGNLTINPQTKEPMDGCVLISEDIVYNQYTYEYLEKTNSLCRIDEEQGESEGEDTPTYTEIIYRSGYSGLANKDSSAAQYSPSTIEGLTKGVDYITEEDYPTYSEREAELGPFYLKHEILNNEVINSYVCFSTDTERCMRGGEDGASFETSRGIVQEFQTYYSLSNCDYGLYDAWCSGNIYIYASSDGYVTGNSIDTFSCYVTGNGFSACGYEC
ncbi:MAG: prepilin-type N-terminal cleavage/methylation domain-containing protein [Bacilli bacterium]|nr:prepilin-type N-terminal cleavage/methylation domain-containing protein [Bacilli bacterium]